MTVAANPHRKPLADADPTVFDLIKQEEKRQNENLELIASENIASLAVRQAMESVLTDKYAEGYPGARYYGGCEVVDVVENLARDRAKELFGAEYANVQPHSGQPGEHGGLLHLPQARRHRDGHGPLPRRPPHPRLARQLLRPALQLHRLRHRPRDRRS